MGSSLTRWYSLLAIALAVTGTYGLVAYAVARRTSEIGVRIALGASSWDILRAVAGRGLLLAGAGVALGVAGSLALTRVLKAQLFETSPTDAVTFAGVSALLLAISALASYVPARRAMRVDPVAALRAE